MIAFEWITKPKLLLSFVDNLFMVTELAIVLFTFAMIAFYLKERQRAKIKKLHGKHCTCWTCMGIS